MNDGERDPEQLLWVDLPEWADEVPEDSVCYLMEELVDRHKIKLRPYDPNNKGKGRKVVLVKKSDFAKKRCKACGKEDEHFTFQCPNDPDRELMEQKVINGLEIVVHYDFCKSDGHSSWRCPDLQAIPFGPMDGKYLFCEACGVEGEHWTDVAPTILKNHRSQSLDSGISMTVNTGLRTALSWLMAIANFVGVVSRWVTTPLMIVTSMFRNQLSFVRAVRR